MHNQNAYLPMTAPREKPAPKQSLAQAKPELDRTKRMNGHFNGLRRERCWPYRGLKNERERLHASRIRLDFERPAAHLLNSWMRMPPFEKPSPRLGAPHCHRKVPNPRPQHVECHSWRAP